MESFAPNYNDDLCTSTNFLSEIDSESSSDLYPELDDLFSDVRTWLRERENGIYKTSELDDADILMLIQAGILESVYGCGDDGEDDGVGDEGEDDMPVKGSKEGREFRRNRKLLETKKNQKIKEAQKSRGVRLEKTRIKSVQRKKRRMCLRGACQF